jgi:hypothetical protein
VTSREQVERNERIAAAHSRGEPLSAIAKKEKLTVRHVRRVVDDAVRDAGSKLQDVDATALVLKVIRVQERAVDRLDELSTTADNSSAQVGAARAAATAGSALLDTAERAGLLPPPRTLRARVDLQAAGEAIADIATRHGIDMDELFAEWDSNRALVPVNGGSR